MGSSQSNIAKRVDLKGKGIKDLETDLKHPHMLPTFPRLEVIDLRSNKIDRIPDSIVADLAKSPLVIEFCTTLLLKKNRLAEVPECLYTLVNLQILDLSHNELTSVPNKLVNFYRLNELHLNNNQMTRLPYAINKCKSLRSLSFGHNKIVWLPNTLAKMKLENLSVDPNPLDQSYEETGGMDHLIEVVRKQRVPKIYFDEALAAAEHAKKKEEKLSHDGLLVRRLLGYKDGLKALDEFCHKEHAEENLKFYKAVKAFRSRYQSPIEIRTQELIADAKAIFEKFISDKGAEQVNLPAEAVRDCKKSFLDSFNYPQGINQWIFDPAFQASFDLMVRDTFTRFRIAPEGKGLVAVLQQIDARKKTERAERLRRGTFSE